MKNDASPSPRAGLRRRDFLALGSIFAAAPWLERAATAATLAKAVAAAPARPISVGYLEGSGEVRDLHRMATDLRLLTVSRQGDTLVEGRRVVPAASLPAGDSSLAGAAVRIAIRGLYPALPAAAAMLPRAIDLDVSVPSVDLSQGAGFLFQAWSYRRLPAEDLSAPLSFLISPDWYSDFAVTLSVLPSPGASRRRLSRAAFTLGDDRGRPRLQRGAYLLAINPGSWDSPVELPEAAAGATAAGLVSVLLTVQPEGVLPAGAAR